MRWEACPWAQRLLRLQPARDREAALFYHVLLASILVATTGSALAGIPRAEFPGTRVLRLVHEGHTGAAQASGTVNSVDTTKHTVNISHGSIRALGWPAMTMDFPVGSDVDIGSLRPGMRVNFTLVHGETGCRQRRFHEAHVHILDRRCTGNGHRHRGDATIRRVHRQRRWLPQPPGNAFPGLHEPLR